jgi:26S proteasome regulatory subunit N9
MDVCAPPALEEQRKAHPELGELIDQLQKYSSAKLYHQLTQALLQYLTSPPFHPSQASAAKELSAFFEGFIKGFETKFDKIRWVEILSIVSKPQTPDAALELILPYEASMASERDAKFMWTALKADKLTLSGKLDEAKELLEELGAEIDKAYEVDALIQSNFYKTYANLWKKLGRHQEFYRSSILYLKFTPIARIPQEERAPLAFEIGIAAMLAAEEFNFMELMQQELLASLDGSNYAWIKDLLNAFSEGKFDMYDQALAKHRGQIDALPDLKGAEKSILTPKLQVLAMMELAFRKPKKQRRLSFEELAQHCRADAKEVEHLVMKAMAKKLIKGKIDEVLQMVLVTWVKPRILDTVRIGLMRERMDQWALQTGQWCDKVEELAPELLVS